MAQSDLWNQRKEVSFGHCPLTLSQKMMSEQALGEKVNVDYFYEGLENKENHRMEKAQLHSQEGWPGQCCQGGPINSRSIPCSAFRGLPLQAMLRSSANIRLLAQHSLRVPGRRRRVRLWLSLPCV